MNIAIMRKNRKTSIGATLPYEEEEKAREVLKKQGYSASQIESFIASAAGSIAQLISILQTLGIIKVGNNYVPQAPPVNTGGGIDTKTILYLGIGAVVLIGAVSLLKK